MSKNRSRSPETRRGGHQARRVEYGGDIWSPKGEPSAELTDLLTATDCLVVLRNGEPPYCAVIGVPHQAAVGQEYICEQRTGEGKRDSDENAAAYALVAFTELKNCGIPCKLVIMAHSTMHDPNKRAGSPYCQEIFADETLLLFECHGSGPSRVLPLELSAGSNSLVNTLSFGAALTSALDHRFTVGAQKRPSQKRALIYQTDGSERDGELQLAAVDTQSLKEAARRGIPALHLEAKPEFRKPVDGTNSVTADGLVLGQAIAQAIVQHLSEPRNPEI